MPALVFSAGMSLPNQIYVDSNVAVAFFYKTHTFHTQAATFFLESVAQSKRLLFSSLTLDELWYILMMTWHKDATGNKFDVKNKAHIAKWAKQAEQTTDKLLALSNVSLCAADPVNDLCARALERLTKEHFGPRDAFHVATASEVGVDAVATMDADFDSVADLVVLKIA